MFPPPAHKGVNKRYEGMAGSNGLPTQARQPLVSRYLPVVEPMADSLMKATPHCGQPSWQGSSTRTPMARSCKVVKYLGSAGHEDMHVANRVGVPRGLVDDLEAPLAGQKFGKSVV